MNSLPDDLGPRLRKSLDHGTAPELSPELVSGAAGRTAPKLTNPRARLQVAGGGVLIVAALAVAALVVVPSLSRPPLFTAAASSASSGATAANVPAAHSLIRIWAEYHYHPGASLSTSGGKGDVYQLVRAGSGSKRIAALDGIFSLAGDTPKVDDSDRANPSWTTGSTDGTSPSLQLTWSGAGDWWFSDPSADPQVNCSTTSVSPGSSGSSSGSSGSSGSAGSAGDIPPTPANPVVPPVCDGTTQDTAPSKAPTGEDARTQAQKLFASTGFTVSASDIQVESDSSQTTATAYLEIGGVKTALDWGVTWASTGTISSAYGHSVSVVDRGSYSTISATDAVSRLTDSRWSGSAGPKYEGGIRAYSAVGTTVGSAPVPDSVTVPPAIAPTPVPSSSPTDTPTDAPTATPTDAPTATPTDTPSSVPTDQPTAVPTDTPTPIPTGPPIIDVTITKAEPTLLLMWDSKGDAWLVPGFAMRIENGWWSGIVSLAPAVIALPPVPSVESDVVAP